MSLLEFSPPPARTHTLSQTTHYSVLGVLPSASPEQIRRIYRTLAKALHPDVNQSPDATQRFAAIAAAYDVLSDPNKRRAYDLFLAEKLAPAKPVDTRAHYTWTNIAAQDADAIREANRQSEIDELYDTFFSAPKTKAASPRQANKAHTSKPASPKPSPKSKKVSPKR